MFYIMVLFIDSPSLSISKEEIEKLSYIRPQTVINYILSYSILPLTHSFYFQIGAASRIPGIKPSSILRLLHYIKSQNMNKAII